MQSHVTYVYTIYDMLNYFPAQIICVCLCNNSHKYLYQWKHILSFHTLGFDERFVMSLLVYWNVLLIAGGRWWCVGRVMKMYASFADVASITPCGVNHADFINLSAGVRMQSTLHLHRTLCRSRSQWYVLMMVLKHQPTWYQNITLTRFIPNKHEFILYFLFK